MALRIFLDQIIDQQCFEVFAEIWAYLTEEVGPRKQFLCWVTPEFDTLAKKAYEGLGSPEITLNSSWDVFKQMCDVLEHVYH